MTTYLNLNSRELGIMRHALDRHIRALEERVHDAADPAAAPHAALGAAVQLSDKIDRATPGTTDLRSMLTLY